MFLKAIKLRGFKSFADEIVINFDNPVTGVVGPNGCGKSNISDAIRFVLGEKSSKSLRGDKMTDVIFAGSENRKALNMAEVTLVFDNSKHKLNSDLDEIEITRKIYASDDQEAEYLINHRNVRLKDINDLILDSGIGKDTLSIISQGNITSFAEAKPFERRALFEDAAGVSKYKKRKIETLNALDRTKDNLDRTFDILNELEKQVVPLKRQARKATLYLEKKTRLESIEVSVIVDEINKLSERQKEIEKQIFDMETDQSMASVAINKAELEISESKSELRELDKSINTLQDELIKVVNEIQALDKRKVELDEKRKYAIEVGNNQEKAKHIKEMMLEAKTEYEDRKNRYIELTKQIELISKELEDLANNIVDINLKREEENGRVRILSNKAEVLENLIKNPFDSQNHSGVKAVMENKNSLFGILDVVAQALIPDQGYEEALKAAIAGSAFHIVCKNEDSAKNAINFLKKNHSGRATFIPLTVCKEYSIAENDLIICKNTKGFLGSLDEFISCEPTYDALAFSLLGNTIVVDNIDNAVYLSDLLNRAYKVVTLEGDVINKGGTMTGGRVKNETSIITARSELDRIKADLDAHLAKQEIVEKDYAKLVAKKEEDEAELTDYRIKMATLEPVMESKKAKYESLKQEYADLNPNDTIDEDLTTDDELVNLLSAAYAAKDSITVDIKSKRDARMKLSADIDRKEIHLRTLRKDNDQSSSSRTKVYTERAVIETNLKNNLDRLASTYNMTFDFALKQVENTEVEENAKEEVAKLRAEIEALGNINMDAPKEYEEVNERYEFTKKNYDELVESRDKILAVIDELDQTMKTQFMNTFNEINAHLNDTFVALFGGGRAKLKLEDPEDVLNTGIDVDVQPPGKAVQSIRLFSGGEKTLIAISVLFTILKVKKSPLVVFDEVEAALDQANVERFAKHVKQFSDDTQFIIITHRPGTMSNCDVLYGVTMQKKGISELLKVKLVDAINMAEPEENKENN